MLFGKTGTQSGRRHLPRLRHAADDGGGGATFAGGQGASGKLDSGISWRTTRRTSSGRGVRCTTPSSPGSRFWSASRCPTRSQPHRQGRHVPQDVLARAVAVAAAGRARRLSALHARTADVLHVRRYADADRPRLSVPVPAGLPSAALAVDRARRASVRLLAGVGALSGAAAGILLRLPGALEQEQQSRQRVRPLVPQSVPARETVRRQWRRISDAQLHPHARHHDPRPGRRPLAARVGARDPDAAAAGSPA